MGPSLLHQQLQHTRHHDAIARAATPPEGADARASAPVPRTVADAPVGGRRRWPWHRRRAAVAHP
ncbi:hypothetical protein [Paraconexibacter algicola]|uniref:Uncharacterized protein n=1 Tax=Paraconexibacter algicola TaxID=2133960 RepID=A0A2T4UEB3_9ACTN|nr:hypothetical protein [Paraconexibacter algicola]PTL56123.1 hypothetical protein C7Y72_14105 [Paraconexibacter algicola]